MVTVIFYIGPVIFLSKMEHVIDTRLLEYFDPKIRPFVENVQMEEEFSILPGSLDIFDACSGYSNFVAI